MLVTVDAYDELMMLLSRTWHLPSSICPMLTMLGQSLRIIHICQRLMFVVLALEDDDATTADSSSLGTTSAPCRHSCFQDIFFSLAY